jgi:hypothetical protein
MSDDASPLPPDATQALVDALDKAGFFEQVRTVERTLKGIAGDLRQLGDATVRGLAETERLIAHILALEAAVAVLMRTTPQDIDALRAAIRDEIARRTAGAPSDGGTAAATAVENLLSRADRR